MKFHLVTDTPVYIDLFISKAKTFSEEENYYVLIKKGKVKNIKYDGINLTDLEGAIQKFQSGNFSKIFIHYLNAPAIDFLNRIYTDVPVYWFFWGGDGYKHPYLKSNLFLPKTREILDRIKHRNRIEKIFDFFKTFAFKYKLENALMKIDYCCTQVMGDYELIKEAVPNLPMQHKLFSYKGADLRKIRNIEKKSEKGLRILVGNSANPTNNHFDMFNALKQHEAKIESIICPLSYAGTQEYIGEVELYGRTIFGEKFHPVKDFLPKDQFIKLTDSIDAAVFFHLRQQGYSSSLLMLEQNKKVLLNPNSSLLKMYKDFGIENVHSDLWDLFNSDLKDNSQLFQSLGQATVDRWYREILND